MVALERCVQRMRDPLEVNHIVGTVGAVEEVPEEPGVGVMEAIKKFEGKMTPRKSTG